MTQASVLPEGYAELLEDIKQRFRRAQTRASTAASRELLHLYWQIGGEIVVRQERGGWGSAVIERLAHDLAAEFPGGRGFSTSNLWRMRHFYLAYEDDPANLAQAVQDLAERELPATIPVLPWGHHVALFEKVKDRQVRQWYGMAAAQHGWSRAVLIHQIELDLYSRRGAAVTNFERTLPPPQSDLARETLKDPYVFEFLTLRDEAAERELERALVDRIRDFLLELGAGFAFMGSQYHLQVGGQDFYVDLLFYHHRLRCLVAIDLKMVDFAPAFAGTMNFYLSALDDLVRHEDDGPSVGLILCKGKNRTVAEYSLRDLGKPVGVSEYRLTRELPAEMANALPELHRLEQILDDGGES